MRKASGCARVRCAAILAVAFCGGVRAAEKHPFGIDDDSALRRARAVAVSPDGKMVLYDVSHAGVKGPRAHEWRLIDVSGGNSRKLELSEHFTPSGFTKEGDSLYGIEEIEKLGRLSIVPLAAGKPTITLSFPSGVHSAFISPDGTRLAVLANPEAKDPLAEAHHVVEDAQTSLYVVGVHGEKGAWWCPALNYIGDIAWSLDGREIAVVTATPKIGHHDLHSYIDVCSPSGARRISEIASATAGIAWVDGGRELAVASTTTAVLTPEHIFTAPASGGALTDRTADLAGSALTITSDVHGGVWVETHRGVITDVDSFRDDKLTPMFRWTEGAIAGPSVNTAFSSSPDVAAFTVGDPSHAINVAVVRDGKLEKITHEGDDTLASVDLGEVRVVHWTAKDGTKLEGLATFPAGYDSTKKYPFLVLPHGGPEANDTLDFDFFSRLIAGLGYVVLQPEYRGSTGYGSDFLAAIYQHFGDRAYSDVDSATDFAIAQGWADPNRLAIFGWSAGGFMTSWTVTQTHRYKAAIEGAGITDWLSFIPTSDIWQVDYDARLQEKDPTPLLQFSAVMHADAVTTPLLILHGEADIRVPTFQGREYFILLAERGKTVRMVTYPGSPHFPILGEQRRDVFKEVADWLERYNP
ncbi:MAG: S9 family peptidase [Candidatus Acidiferrales bacterium]